MAPFSFDRQGIVSILDQAQLYICLDSKRIDSPQNSYQKCYSIARQACAGGVNIIQLRDKDSLSEKTLGPLSFAQQVEILQQLKSICHEYGALLAVNDDPTLAHTVAADVCHVGQEDCPPQEVRSIVGPRTIIGQSTHSIAQAQHAIANPEVDYFCLGPIWPTPTKPGRAAVGLAMVSELAQLQPSKPWFTIGGIDGNNISEVHQAGAHKFCMVRAIIDADNPEQAAAQALNAVAN